MKILLLAILFAATALVPYEDFEIIDSQLAAKQTSYNVDVYPWQATVANYTDYDISCHVEVELIDARGFQVQWDARTIGVRAHGRATARARMSVPRGTQVSNASFAAECW